MYLFHSQYPYDMN